MSVDDTTVARVGRARGQPQRDVPFKNTVAASVGDDAGISGAASADTVAGRPGLDNTVAASAALAGTIVARPRLDDAVADTVAPSVAGITAATPTTMPPTSSGDRLTRESHIGRFKILRTLGAGGMGVVYAAYDPRLDREVAVKLLRGGQNSDAARLRLEREAQALAKLAHPNIVSVFDVGTHKGQVWVSMEFVHGCTLGAWIKEKRPGWRQALSVIQQAGRGIVAAHAESLLHRDIKPDNIMVGSDGRVRVMDFGLARAETGPEGERGFEEQRGALSVELTAVGAIMGTPAYMAPEQFLGQVADERTDEFSLAVTLWEALYGSRPFAGDTFVALSSAVTSGTREPVPSDSKVPGWLRRVLERALEIDRNKRFESVRVMFEVIEGHIQRARTRLVMAGLTLGLLVVAVLGVLAAFQWRAAESARAVAQASQAELAAEKLVVEERNVALTDREAKLERALSASRGLRAKMLIPDNREGEALKLGVLAVGIYGPDWVLAPPPEAIDALEHVLAEDVTIVRPALTLTDHENGVRELAYSPDGTRIATVSSEKIARVWDAASGELTATLQGHEDSVWALAYSPDGTRIATASWDTTARVWDAASGKLTATLRGHNNRVGALAYSPDGARIATASWDRTARVWDAASGKRLATLQGHGDTVYALAYSPDGTRIATASWDRTARVWDAASGKLLVTLRGHEDQVVALAYSPDGARVATASKDRTARVWDAASGKPLATLHGHDDAVWTVAFSPDGARIATASEDKVVRVWDAASGKLVARLQGHQDSVFKLVYSPDGTRIATTSWDRTARVWDAASGRLITTLRGHEDAVWGLAYSPDGRHLATGSSDQTASVWDTSPNKRIATLRGHEDSVEALVYSPDGTCIATASSDKTARVWDAASGRLIAALRGHEFYVVALAYSPDGAHLATASWDRTARVWDAASGELIATLQGHEDAVWAVAYSPDGRRLATASEDKTARIWDAASGELTATLQGHEDIVWAVAYSPDGTRIATASEDKTARIWDAASGELTATLQGHEDTVWMVAYSPDGRRVATGSSDQTARVTQLPESPSPRSRATTTKWSRWPTRRTALASRRPPVTSSRASGMQLPANSLPCSEATNTMLSQWLIRLTARA